MSPTTTLPQPSQETMKIQHTTHDESRDAIPSLSINPKLLSASMKVRTFISRRISQTFHSPPLPSHHEDPNPSTGRPLTQFPRFAESKHSFAEKKAEESEEAGHSAQRHHSDKAARKEEKVLSRKNSSGSYLPLKSPTGSSSTRAKGFSIPSLKKKGNFSDLVKERLHRRNEAGNEISNRENDVEKAGEKSEKLVKAYTLRRAMLEGKLERVVPPPSTAISSGQNRRPPPRPARNPFLDTASATPIVAAEVAAATRTEPRPGPRTLKPTDTPSSRTSLSSAARPTSTSLSRARKTKSASSKIASLIGNSADILDETRREIQGRFKEPFEYLGYPSFSLARRADGAEGGESDADSDESFYCLGDREAGVLGMGAGMEGSPGVGTGIGTGTSKRDEREMERRFNDISRPKKTVKESESGGGNRLSNLTRGGEQDAQVPPEQVVNKCKLCGLGIASSYRGLCAECEADLSPLNTQNPTLNPENKYSDSEYEDDLVVDEIPPTLPLKIRKQTLLTREKSVMRKVGPDAYRQRNPFAFEDSESDDECPPRVPPKDDVVLGLSLPNKTYQPQLTSVSHTKQPSHHTKVETQSETSPNSQPQTAKEVHRLSSWQSDGLDSPTYEEAQQILDRWSDCFGEGALHQNSYTRDSHGDGVPLVRTMDCDGVKRDSEFYRFWDEMLREHAPRRERMRGERSESVREYWEG
ncbi:hypothetical protein BKA64DRAFT_664228 [Cadophora sp. MPI-SDFR-AT-0126]|nr:hypothetical protein BKA64DRAFT_664228 [Leotiomycetes sp. MPI-SDFR-AT-0126]